MLILVDELGVCDALLLKEKATDEVQGLAFRVLLLVNRNNLVNIYIFCHQSTTFLYKIPRFEIFFNFLAREATL